MPSSNIYLFIADIPHANDDFRTGVMLLCIIQNKVSQQKLHIYVRDTMKGGTVLQARVKSKIFTEIESTRRVHNLWTNEVSAKEKVAREGK
jgi:hypothetical protein